MTSKFLHHQNNISPDKAFPRQSLFGIFTFAQNYSGKYPNLNTNRTSAISFIPKERLPGFIT
jgi:hypothetical protein